MYKNKPEKTVILAVAGQIDLKNGLRIWIPPTGRPYWIGKIPYQAGPDLTNEELKEYGLHPPISYL